jgi:periplasmic protein TonB
MSMSKIGWDEIIFENRNRDYGAYILRYNYPRNLTVSTLIVIVIFLSSMLCTQLFKGKHQPDASKKVTVINYSQLAPPPPIEKTYVPPKTIKVAQEKIQKYVAPKVIKEEVKEEEEMPTIEEVQKNIDTPTMDAEVQGSGNAQVEVVSPPHVEEIVQVKPPEPDPTIKQPEFPGGDKALAKWLESHMKYPAVATRMGIQGVVIVEFTVDIKGHIYDASVVQSLHRLCDAEALRLVTTMPVWLPGESSGKKVTAKRKLPIPFTLG